MEVRSENLGGNVHVTNRPWVRPMMEYIISQYCVSHDRCNRLSLFQNWVFRVEVKLLQYQYSQNLSDTAFDHYFYNIRFNIVLQ